MSAISPEIRLHRIFGVAAVVHAALLLASASYVMSSAWSDWPTRLWVGLTTLWFFWPIILACHVGSSVRRAYIAMAVAAALVALPVRPYLEFIGPSVLLPNDTVLNFSPYTLAPCAIGYARGWAEAKKHMGDDRIILESYGMGTYAPGAPPFNAAACERYKIGYNQTAGCGVTYEVAGHAAGYNRVAVAELTRRHGPAVIAAAEKEEAELEARRSSEKARGTADAESDARAGRLAILLYQSAMDGEDLYREMFRESFHTELKRIAISPQEIGETDLQYVWGYNEAATRELARKYGDEAQSAAWLVDNTSFEAFMRNLESRRSRAK